MFDKQFRNLDFEKVNDKQDQRYDGIRRALHRWGVNPQEIGAQKTNRPALRDHALREQNGILASDFKGMRPRELSNDDMPMYLWIADDRVAVFSVPDLTEKSSAADAADEALEAGFITRDSKLISYLKKIFDSYCDKPSRACH